MQIALFKELVRIEQMLFGFPVLLAAVAVALSCSTPVALLPFFLLLPAFVSARIAGMAFNQFIDAKLDERNRRTSNRPIPSGRVTDKEVIYLAWGSLAVFLGCALWIRLDLFLIAGIAAAALVGYPYAKRVTVTCHLWLGAIHFLNPLMVSLALTDTIPAPILLLGLASASLIIGSDILYATQDYDFDKEYRLCSIPVRLGIAQSIWVARGMHLMTLVFLLCLGYTAYFPLFYYGVVGIAGFFFYRLYLNIGKERIDTLCFTCNTAVSCTVFGFILLSVVWDLL